MALVCPVDHPVGIGTSYCRLCGRDYIDVPDAPVAAMAPAPVPVEVVAPAELSWPELAPAPVVPAQALSVEAPLVSVAAGPVVEAPAFDLPTWAPPVEQPVAEAEPVEEPVAEAAPVEAPAEDAADEAEEAPTKVRVAVDRSVVLVAGAAGFAGGLLAAFGSHALLG